MLDSVNLSLRKEEFPADWKLTTITPIPKKSKTKKWEEFRPINTVPMYEKMLELAAEEIIECCDNNAMLLWSVCKYFYM